MAFHLGKDCSGGCSASAVFEVANDVCMLYERLPLVVGDFRFEDERRHSKGFEIKRPFRGRQRKRDTTFKWTLCRVIDVCDCDPFGCRQWN